MVAAAKAELRVATTRFLEAARLLAIFGFVQSSRLASMMRLARNAMVEAL
jgi:hypothetical protein